MRMNIPSVGDKIKLTADWKFICFYEYRNRDFILKFKSPDVLETNDRDLYNQSFSITLPAKTVLRIDRIYIRRGRKDYDSITFFVIKHPNMEFTKRGFGGSGRFWVKLADANNIEFEYESI